MIIPFSTSICSQCGLAHPALKEGEKCPMAKEKTNSGDEIDFNSFFVSLKNILISQIKVKNIKDSKKFLGNILVEITKMSEGYKEN